MRIVHIITKLELGGAQCNTLASCAAQAAAGHQVTLLAGAGGMLDAEAARLPGVTFVPLPELLHPIHWRADWRALAALTQRLRALAPDLVHTHSSKAGILGRLAAARAGVPVVIHTRNRARCGNGCIASWNVTRLAARGSSSACRRWTARRA